MQKRIGVVPLVGAWAIAFAAGCGPSAPAAPPPPPFSPVVDVKMLMADVVDPSADFVWQSVAINITSAGEEHKRPKTDAEWIAVRNHALMLAEAGNLLMISPRARDNDEWMTLSRAMLDAGAKAYEAAENRDADAILNVGGLIYDTCVACHVKYIAEEDHPEL